MPCWVEEKKGNDFVQSLVYCAAVFVVEPRAERSGEVMGYGEVGGGGRVTAPGDFLLLDKCVRL